MSAQRTAHFLIALLALPAATFAAATECTIDRLAGQYESQYGQMRCQPKGKLLQCCYGNFMSCKRSVQLSLAANGKELTGKWLYPNGASGAARFTVNSDCTLGNGLWGSGDQANAGWSVGKRLEPKTTAAAPKSAPAPAPKVSKPAPAVAAPAPTVRRNNLHWKGDLITRTPTAAIHFRRIALEDPPKRCDQRTMVVAIMRPDGSGEADFGRRTMRTRIAQEIMPAVKRVCPGTQGIEISVFVEGDHLAYARGDVPKGASVAPERITSNSLNETPLALIQADFRDLGQLKYYPSFSLTKPDGSRAPQTGELLTYAGFKAARARNFVALDPAIAERELAQAQQAAVGHSIDHPFVWALIKGGDFAHAQFSLKDDIQRDNAHVLAQAYGLAIQQRCRANVPGGVYTKAFKIGRRSDGSISQTFDMTLLNDLGEAGYGDTEYISVNIGFRFEHIYNEEARSGRLRDSMNDLVSRHECGSEVLTKLHRNVLELVDHHGLR